MNFQNIVQEFFTERKAPAGIIPFRRQGLDKVTRVLVLGSIGNVCNYDDPKLNAMVDSLRKLDAGAKEYQQAWWDLDSYIVKNALHVSLIWALNINAYNPDRVGNMTYRPDVFGQPAASTPSRCTSRSSGGPQVEIGTPVRSYSARAALIHPRSSRPRRPLCRGGVDPVEARRVEPEDLLLRPAA